MVHFNKKRWWQALCGGMALCAVLALCGLYGQCQGVRENVLRLHILANSNSEADQALKLRVRDAVVEAAAGWLDGAEDAGEAREIAAAQLPRLQAVAQQTVRNAGYAYPVKAQLCEMYFTTRQYDQVTMPAGIYEAVRFTIGSGEGNNWWCVVFPPMCMGAATDEDALEGVLTGSQQALVTGGQRYTVAFKLVEWFEKLVQVFR